MTTVTHEIKSTLDVNNSRLDIDRRWEFYFAEAELKGSGSRGYQQLLRGGWDTILKVEIKWKSIHLTVSQACASGYMYGWKSPLGNTGQPKRNSCRNPHWGSPNKAWLNICPIPLERRLGTINWPCAPTRASNSYLSDSFQNKNEQPKVIYLLKTVSK